MLSIGAVERAARVGKVRVKLVYGGSRPLLVRSLRLAVSLRYSRWRDRTLAWLRITVAYLINDTEGLQELVGPGRAWFNRRLASQIMNLVYGLLTLSEILNPLFWFFIILTGPYDSRELGADGSQIRITNAETGAERSLPFILPVDTEEEYTISYHYVLKRRHSDEGFPHDTQIEEYVEPSVRSPCWRLPRAGQGIWSAEWALFVHTTGKWVKYKLPLGPTSVRLVPPKSLTSSKS